MSYKAPRKYSQGRNYGVERQQDFTADIVQRRPYAPYDNRMKKGSNKWTRNMVWTSKEYQPSEGNIPRKYDNPCREMKSPALGSGNTAYPPRTSSISVTRGGMSAEYKSTKRIECVCKYWNAGNCKKGEQCQFLHSWSTFPGMAMLASLEGHNKDIKGIALPVDSNKLFSASSDGTVRIWDCNSGQCVDTTNLQAEAGSLICEGPWVFLGLPNAVKAFNSQTNKQLQLNGVVGQVNAMASGHGMLVAGTSSGSISIWKANENESDPFTYITSLEGHSGEVTCLTVGEQGLYSGSMDKTIKVWDLKTMECVATMKQHTDTVTSLLLWEDFLLSSSLDGTIKSWGYCETKILKECFTHNLQQSVHSLCGIHDSEKKPIIFCSYQNGTVGIYDVPSFKERGKMFCSNTVGTITFGTGGLMFSGEKSGQLRVWNLAAGSKVV